MMLNYLNRMKWQKKRKSQPLISTDKIISKNSGQKESTILKQVNLADWKNLISQ